MLAVALRVGDSVHIPDLPPCSGFPAEHNDQVGLDTLAVLSGYASFVIGNEGEVNKMFAKKEARKNG